MSLPTPLAQAIASAIQAQEGYGTPRAVTITRNNNPGALRTWPGYPSSNNFAVFPDYATGFAATVTDVQTNIDMGLSLAQFITKYEGGTANVDNNNIPVYIANVATRVGIDPNVPMNQAASGLPVQPMTTPIIDPTTGLPIDSTSDINSDPSQSGVVDWATIGLLSD